MRILIVEDEVLIAMHLEMMLEDFGHQPCGIATDPQEALALAASEQPDLALMDVRLARGTSGIEAARLLHESIGLRCLFVSGNIDDQMKAAVRACNPLGFAGKPVLPETLRKALAAAEADLHSAPEPPAPAG
ncbi:response regulator [Parvibaculum sp.]|uniref:response regulator n=1 Tax=Parvibaculum sp. TaxID=2024848 RepID=UPI002BDFDCA0|nr:response regulator [Parvibaculum sp.]HUD50313.1 response regulator [Parvibaculum sp.]